MENAVLRVSSLSITPITQSVLSGVIFSFISFDGLRIATGQNTGGSFSVNSKENLKIIMNYVYRVLRTYTLHNIIIVSMHSANMCYKYYEGWD